MQKVTVKKAELLAKVSANLQTHLKDFSEACDGYREKAMAELTAKFESLKAGNVVELTFDDLDKPVSHERDYRRAIAMLEMSTSDEIELSSHEFSQYVLDDWQWKELFSASLTKYRGSH